MIRELYAFNVGSYVVADEWNANFRVLYKTNLEHEEAIVDANDLIAFPNSDLSAVFNAVNNQLNSFIIPGLVVNVAPECEYYKTLYRGQDLSINLPLGTCGNVRIVVKVEDDRALETPPFTINYTGTKIENIGQLSEYSAGTYYIFIYETNGIAQIKIAKIGE